MRSQDQGLRTEPLCKLHLLHPAPTCAQDGLDPVHLVLVVIFCQKLAQILHLYPWVVITCNFHWCFLLYELVHY